MPEGERPESSGAHNWNHESASETAKRQRGEHAREQAEVIQEYRKTDIGKHITALRERAKIPPYKIDASVTGEERDKQVRANTKYQLRYEQQASLYSYLQNTHHARTIGDAEEKVRHHQVDTGVVRLWVEGRMIEHDDLMEQAIVEGYPELDEDINRMQEQQHWRQADSVSDFLAGLDVDKEDL